MNPEVNQLKEKIAKMEHALKKRETLLNLREELMIKIASLPNHEPLKKELKKKKMELDHLLDESEEWSENELAELKDKFLKLTNPDDYKQLKEREFYDHFCLKLKKIFEEIFEVRKKINGWGLLQYIFGVSPNIQIEGKLIEANKLISAHLPYLNDEKKPFFEKLAKQCISPWGFKHIDTVFKEAYDKICEDV